MKPKSVKVFKHGASASIVIPKVFCEILEIGEGDFLMLELKEDSIVIKKSFYSEKPKMRMLYE